MNELPVGFLPTTARPGLIDFGGVLRPATGGKLLRLNRGGNRFKVTMGVPVKGAEDARRVIARLIVAVSEGLKVPYPLQGVDQGRPGISVVVDGAGQAGQSIALRNVTPGYEAKEGFWLTIYDGSGQGYLHNVREFARADINGRILLPIAPSLRVPFPDGCPVTLTAPTIEGLVTNSVEWELVRGGRTVGVVFTIEEAE